MLINVKPPFLPTRLMPPKKCVCGCSKHGSSIQIDLTLPEGPRVTYGRKTKKPPVSKVSKSPKDAGVQKTQNPKKTPSKSQTTKTRKKKNQAPFDEGKRTTRRAKLVITGGNTKSTPNLYEELMKFTLNLNEAEGFQDLLDFTLRLDEEEKDAADVRLKSQQQLGSRAATVTLKERKGEKKLSLSPENSIKWNDRISVKKCDICLEDYNSSDDVEFTECFHVFHSTCIQEWYKVKKSCPTCKHVQQ